MRLGGFKPSHRLDQEGKVWMTRVMPDMTLEPSTHDDDSGTVRVSPWGISNQVWDDFGIHWNDLRQYFDDYLEDMECFVAMPPTHAWVAKLQHWLQRQRDRVVKVMDQKSIGLCPQGFESPRCRMAIPDHRLEWKQAWFWAQGREENRVQKLVTIKMQSERGMEN
jgi:hypothetical protein